MAAIAPLSAPAVSQQDPLFDALVKYVTTGPGADNISVTTLQDMINAHCAQPGGRAYLETLAHGATTEEAPVRSWRLDAPADGTVELTKTSGHFILNVRGNSAIKFDGTCAEFFIPYSGPLFSGRFWCDDFNDLAPGPVKFSFWADRSNRLTIQILRNEKWIAAFSFPNIVFNIGYGVHNGDGMIS